MKLRSELCLLLAALLSLVVVSTAHAGPMLDMGVMAPTSGSISYAGGANPLVGMNIDVDNVTGLGTPVNAGVPGQRDCIGCILTFTSGNFTGSDPSHWFFAGGGTITVVGGVDLTNDGDVTDPGDIAAGTTLLSGSFTTINVSLIGGTFQIAGAAFTDVKDTMLTGFYGLNTGAQYSGNFNISFDATGTPPSAFTSSQVLSGDIVNEPVDVPSSLLLLGSGLIGFGYLTARGRRS